MCRILYRLLVSLARLAVRSGRSKDLEIIVLRHQLTVLHRLSNTPSTARSRLAGSARWRSRPHRGWMLSIPGQKTPDTNANFSWRRTHISVSANISASPSGAV